MMSRAAKLKSLRMGFPYMKIRWDAPRLAVVPRQHMHDFVHPVFTERRVDGFPILTGMRCSGCSATKRTDFTN